MDDKSKKSFLKGFGYLINQEYDKALDELKEVVRNNTHMVEMYVALGTLFRNKGEYLKAIHIHESAVGEKNLKEDLKKQILHELVLDYKLSGQFEKAIYYLNTLLKIDKSPVLYKLMATLLFEKGEYENAIKFYSKYAKLSKKDISKEIAYGYFKLSEKTSDLKGKIKQLKKSINSFSSFRLANYELIKVYKKIENDKLLYNQLNWIIDNDVFFKKDDINFVSTIYYDKEKLDEFVKKCIGKVSTKNKNPIYYIFLSEYFSKKGDKQKAISILQDFLKEKKINIVAKQYVLFKEDEILSNLFDEYLYICKKCGESFNDYYDICPRCKSIQTLFFK
ncbi:tetratricopeptide repeat protein [Deferribacter abyssi]|uniref:tetratricopeptide repeat protein n=1 Tax=Deferribacter abyssi TaxID=213806 RepID=UPI003C22A7D4